MKPICVYCSQPHDPTRTGQPSKRCKLVYLLDHWQDVFDPNITSPNGRPGDGTGIGLLPAMSHHRSVIELARCLTVLAAAAPSQHSHLLAWHGAEWRIAYPSQPVRNHQGRPRRDRTGGLLMELGPGRRERIVPRWVDRGKVERAHDWLRDNFVGRLDLPEDLLDAATLSSDQVDAKTERKRRRRAVA